jgi:2-formylbenzoate dehydrogenase
LSEASYATHDPATGELLARVPDASEHDVAAAVERVSAAAEQWGTVPPRDRASAVRAIARVLRDHAAELAELDARDAGHPITAMRADVEIAAEAIEVHADLVHGLAGETFPATGDHLHYTVREPFGVVARIVPYNHPLMFAATRIAAPLLAGNAVVLKAAEATPLSALRLAELLRDVLPDGALSVVTGQGSAAGRALVAHPEIRRIGFIGSVETGLAIQRLAAAEHVKTVTLELGGKNPMIVYPDADPQTAAQGAVRGMNFHGTAGQSCGSTSRLLVHEASAPAVIEAVGELAGAIRIGPPLDAATEMGALISAGHRDRVAEAVETARIAGATIVCGGGTLDGRADLAGAFYAPTVLAGVTPAMRIAAEEVFGPVLSVLVWRDEEQMVRLANATPFGLTASIWTEDVARAHRLARRLRAGYVWINTCSRHFAGTPFGGVKDSGVGREEGLDELLSYTETKAVHLALGAAPAGGRERSDHGA